MGILVLGFLLLAAGADTVEKGLVPRDYVARLPLDHAIERVVMLYHGVADGAAAAADHVRVRVAAPASLQAPTGGRYSTHCGTQSPTEVKRTRKPYSESRGFRQVVYTTKGRFQCA